MKVTEPTVINLDEHKDNRGNFIELLRQEGLKQKRFGQLSVTTINPKREKGNHYHKIRWEWFCIIQGKVHIKLVQVKTHEEQIILLNERNPQIFCIPPLWNHVLVNKGNKKAIAVVYSSIVFNEKNPDVFFLEK